MKNGDILRFSKWWTLLGVVLVAFVVYLSLAPLSASKLLAFPESDKILHLSVYATMMLWFGQIARKGSYPLLVASGLIVLGVLLEFLQGLTGYRTFEYLDMAANTLGVILGLLIVQTRLGRVFYTFEMLLSPSGD